nr:gamma-glutamyl-gamma-aminobutyrate hydrolase family protein [Ectothiorhodospira magna]
MVVTGRDLDGIVQAVEDPAAEYLIGVQWHPEFLLYFSGQRALFRELVRCAHKHLPGS